MNHYVYRNLQATEISKLQLIIRRLRLADNIHSDIIHLSSLRIGHFMTKKTDMTFCFRINM